MVRVNVRVTSCVSYVSTKPTAFSSRITVTIQVVEESSNLNLRGWFCSHCLQFILAGGLYTREFDLSHICL